MPRQKEPVIVQERKWTSQKGKSSKTYIITISETSGLPSRICQEWQRKSFQKLPAELLIHSNPKSKTAAKIGADALVVFLKNKIELEGSARRIAIEDITVDEWIKKFTAVETSPRTGINASRNRPYSVDSVETYKSYYECHIKGDPITKLKMTEVEEDDALEFATRMSVKKLKDGRAMGGTRTYAGVIVFVRMAFKHYQRKNRRWINPFQYIDPPKHKSRERDALSEEEVLKLFKPGVHMRTMELAVCAAIFLSGLRRSEVFALKPEDLDWYTPKITVRRAWQNFEDVNKRVLGPPKGKKVRDALFDPILQQAIKKLWEENGQHEFVFSFWSKKAKKAYIPGPSWTRYNLSKWLERAEINTDGRIIVPHSARHSLATILIDSGENLLNVQKLLDHESLKTTKGYIHSTGATIRKMGKKITGVMEDSKENVNKANTNAG